METTPNLKAKLRGAKKAPIDESLRELRGFAVEIKEPTKPGDPVRAINDIMQETGSSHMGLPSIQGQGTNQPTFGKY